MKRTLIVVLCTLAASLVAAPAHAGEPHVPRVTILGLDGTIPGPEGEEQDAVAIDAYDPDGVITEVQVEFSDGEFVYAHTYCFIFGRGEVAHMRIPHSFAGPGVYEVHARAFSVRECGARGAQFSRWVEATIEVG